MKGFAVENMGGVGDGVGVGGGFVSCFVWRFNLAVPAELTSIVESFIGFARRPV